MTLIDTSVWVAHWRADNRTLRGLLASGEALTHPWVVGEIAMGSLGARRAAILADLRMLPCATLLRDEEVMAMVEAHRLHGTGVGWVDAHLLASARVAGAMLWTVDRPLAAAAKRLGVAFAP